MTEGETPRECVGGYELCAPIAEGGMANVWLARAIAAPERLVALKVIKPEFGRNQEFVAMFLDESRIASRLSHPNIVSLVEVGREPHDDRRPFLAMELLRGPTLLALWNAAQARGRRLPCEVVAWIGARLADALHYAHERVDDRGAPEELVHRDVNPANIIVTREGVPKLIDFGLARARDRLASTAFGVVKGKLAYLAPEQAHGRPADRRSDVFALGVTLWEVSLDRRLFLDETDVETIRRVREAEVPNPTTLDAQYPHALAQVVCRALARDPGERFQTAGELRDALDRWLSTCGRPVSAADVRALVQDLCGSEPPAAWERLADEALAEREKTRVWEGSQRPLPKPAPPPRKPSAGSRRAPLAFLSRLHFPGRGPSPAVLAAGVASALLLGLIARGCRAGHRADALEQRIARLEGLLRVEDVDAPATGTPPAVDGGHDLAANDGAERAASCALAKIGAYQAWQDVVARAKSSASGPQAACASYWSESRKQGCYYAALAPVRAAQAARDAVIAGGGSARDAVRAIHDDPKNDALARARAASEGAFVACDDDAGPLLRGAERTSVADGGPEGGGAEADAHGR